MTTSGTLRIYRGITIDRIPHSGMYSALVPGYGYVMAETLHDIKSLIRDMERAS